MAKTRSPNYPTISLADALEAIRPVFKAENRNKMSRLVLAKHMGYTSLNGRALSKIGAVRAYGLIEGSGDDLRVSPDAISALSAPEGSTENRQAIERCAFKSDLFRELRKQYPDTLPSMENLRYNLVQRRFTEEAAEKAATNYLATMQLVSAIQDGYIADSVTESAGNEPMQRQQTIQQPLTPAAKMGIQRADFPLPEGLARIEFPADMSHESYEDLDAWVKLVMRRAKRSIKPDV